MEQRGYPAGYAGKRIGADLPLHRAYHHRRRKYGRDPGTGTGIRTPLPGKATLHQRTGQGDL